MVVKLGSEVADILRGRRYRIGRLASIGDLDFAADAGSGWHFERRDWEGVSKVRGWERSRW